MVKTSPIAMPPQLEKVITSPLIVAAWAALAFVISLFLLNPGLHELFKTIPAEVALKKAEGTLSSFRQYTNEEGLRFQLSGSDKYFVLSNYSGAEPAVRRSLPGAQFTVFYDPNREAGTLWSKRRSFVAYVVFVDGSPVRTYQQVAGDANRDLIWVPWVGYAFAFIALGLAGWAVKLRFWRSSPLPDPKKAG